MGCQVAPAQLLYDFCLDDHVPADHMLRGHAVPLPSEGDIDRHPALGRGADRQAIQRPQHQKGRIER